MGEEPIRFEELVDKLMEKFKRYSPTRGDIRYQLLWMLKHDMMRIYEEGDMDEGTEARPDRIIGTYERSEGEDRENL